MYKRLLLLWIIVGVALSLYAWFIRSSLVVTAASVTLSLAGVVALLIKQDKPYFGYTVGKPGVFVISLTAFLVLFTTSLVIFAARPDPYIRPLAYYILTSLATGALILSAATSDTDHRGQAVMVLLGAVGLGLSLEWTVTLMYPVTVGLDPWYHQWYTQKIINDGGIQAIGQRLPLFHLIAAGTMLLTKLPYNLAVMWSVSLLQVVADVLLLYKIGSIAIGKRVGMIGAVLLATASWHVWFGYWTIPNTLALPETLAAVYLLMRWYRDNWKPAIPLLVALCIATLFTHTMAMIWVGLAIGVAIVRVVVCRWQGQRRHSLGRTIATFGVFVAVIAVWSLWQGDYLTTLKDVLTNPNVIGDYAYNYHPSPQEVAVGSIVFPNTSLFRETWIAGNARETLFNVSGMLLFFGAALVGVLILAKSKSWGSYVWWMTGLGTLTLAVGCVPMLFGVSVLQQRWWYLSQACLALPLAAVVGLGLYTKRRTVIAGVLALTVLMTFLAAVGRPDNMDNQTFSKNQLVRYALTGPEVATLIRIHEEHPGAILGLDGYYLTAARQTLGYGQALKDWGYRKLTNTSPNLLSGEFGNVKADIILLRQMLVDDPIADGGGVIYHLTYDPKVVIQEQGWEMVEDNGSVAIFIKKGY